MIELYSHTVNRFALSQKQVERQTIHKAAKQGGRKNATENSK